MNDAVMKPRDPNVECQPLKQTFVFCNNIDTAYALFAC